MSLLNGFLTKYKNYLLKKTKCLSRRYLYEFLENNLRLITSQQGVSCVLNIGSGGQVGSRINKFFSNSGVRIISIDIDQIRNPDLICDASNVAFKSESFDIVLCVEVLEHIFFPHECINEIHRVLKTNGNLILTTRFIYPLHDRPNDYFRYTKYGLEKILNRFNKVIIESHLNWIETIALLIMRLLKEDYLWVKIFAGLIYFLGKLIDVSRKFTGFFKSDHIASGYMVLAKK